MLDLVAIAQSAPGAIAVNEAIVVGYKLAGIAGVLTAIIATIGYILGYRRHHECGCIIYQGVTDYENYSKISSEQI